jgi:transposase-like protein
MPKTIPQEVKNRAMELYLKDDSSAREIADAVSSEYSVTVSNQTVYSWAKKYDWDSKRTDVKTKALERTVETESGRLVRLQQEHLNVYGNIREKATAELNNLTFDRAFDAVKAASIGIDGERQVIEGLINLQFVQDVIQILINEIDDAELMQRIAAKLRLLVSNTAHEKKVTVLD